MVDTITKADQDQGEWRKAFDEAQRLAEDTRAKFAAAWIADADYYNAHARFMEEHKKQLAKCHTAMIRMAQRKRDTDHQEELEDYHELIELIKDVGPRGVIEIIHEYLKNQNEMDGSEELE